jgi:hypothetical protein
MMRPAKLYIHHVGIEGADADFPKTVYRAVEIELICDALSSDDAQVEQTRDSLSRLFPSGQCNCWGVPEQAITVIRNLTALDYVLLVRTTRDEGEVSVLCWVKHVLPFTSRELSRALWQKEKYPLIFFFDSELINLTWQEFCHQVGYWKYDPRGRFLSVSDNKLASYGGAKGYASYLRSLGSEKVIRLSNNGEGKEALDPASVSTPTLWPSSMWDRTEPKSVLGRRSWPGDNLSCGSVPGMPSFVSRKGRTA